MSVGGRIDPVQLFDAQAVSIPNHEAQFRKMQDLYKKRWWHELSVVMLEVLTHPETRHVAPDMHFNVLTVVRPDLSPMIYVKLVIAVVSVLNDPQEALDLLGEAIPSMISIDAQGHQCIQCIRAVVLMKNGPNMEAKRTMDEAKEFIEGRDSHEVEATLLALYHKAHARLLELNGDYVAFYETAFNVILYSRNAELTLPPEELQALAYKTAVTALVALGVHNFGRLLMCKEMIEALERSGEAWLLDCIRICNAGDVAKFLAFIEANKQRLGMVQELANPDAMADLDRKVRLMALLHLVYHTPADVRVFTFKQVSDRCCIPEDEVEFLVLKAFSLKLMVGKIDGLDCTVDITSVESRVLDMGEIRSLTDKIKQWRNVVRETEQLVGKHAEGIAA